MTKQEKNKIIVLSIGYSSCHWCHVMEKESFINKVIAKYMNENFISIKVDREERPDIDNLYMSCSQLMGIQEVGHLISFFTKLKTILWRHIF